MTSEQLDDLEHLARTSGRKLHPDKALALIARVRELEAERDEWRALTITPRGAQYYIDKAAQAEAERDRLAAEVERLDRQIAYLNGQVARQADEIAKERHLRVQAEADRDRLAAMELDKRFRYCYRYTPSWHGFAKHVYEVIGRDGAIEFHVADTSRMSDHGLPRYSGGLEEHRKQCPPYRDCAPDHMDCRLTGGPCWHDGTSLYAMETLIPRWELDFPDHDAVFVWLTGEYIRRFRLAEEEGQ